jgi:hypothetical protein
VVELVRIPAPSETYEIANRFFPRFLDPKERRILLIQMTRHEFPVVAVYVITIAWFGIGVDRRARELSCVLNYDPWVDYEE